MSETTKIRSSKLAFKGDKKSSSSKKRKRKEKEEAEGDDDGADPQSWVKPDVPIQVLGPTFIVHPSSPHKVCIAFDGARQRITVSSLPDADEDEGGELRPKEVSQVWVTTRVAGSETINLRTADGKFMSCDVHGIVSADREARGPQEEWTPVILPDTGGMVAFQNNYGKYLSIDEAAGGALQLRGDSDEIGFAERFFVRVQLEYKKKAGEEERKKKQVESVGRIDEAGSNMKFQAWGAGRSVVSDMDKGDLKRAKKEGTVSEALLDRRAKLKSDRFC